jgi:hypothetical protein
MSGSEKAYSTEQRLNGLISNLGSLVSFDGWHDTSGMANSWGKSTGWFKYGKLVLAGTNWLYLTAKLLVPGTVADTTSLLNTPLASTYQPVTAQRFTVWCDNLKPGTVTGSAEGAAFELQPDGSIHCFGIQLSATRVDVNQLIPLDL